MKKNTRAHVANPEPRGRRKLRLSRDTVKVLNSTDLSRAIGGSIGCDTTSYTTEQTRTQGSGGAIG